jgi:hypothetical protein
MTIMEFYTYTYTRSDGTPYYVGKGKGNRAFAKKGHNIAVPERGRIQFQYWGSEQEALDMEVWWIKFWGRKDNGTGILRNMTDGGVGGKTKGHTGHKHSEEARRKIKLARAKQVFSEESIQKRNKSNSKPRASTWKMSLAQMGNKKKLGYKDSEETQKRRSYSARHRKKNDASG